MLLNLYTPGSLSDKLSSCHTEFHTIHTIKMQLRINIFIFYLTPQAHYRWLVPSFQNAVKEVCGVCICLGSGYFAESRLLTFICGRDVNNEQFFLNMQYKLPFGFCVSAFRTKMSLCCGVKTWSKVTACYRLQAHIEHGTTGTHCDDRIAYERQILWSPHWSGVHESLFCLSYFMCSILF